MNERPSLHALAVFLAVVEHGTMTAAAEAEGLAQPAISVHVRNLERFYGVPLMERSGRRVRPTDAGELVAIYARRLLGLADELGQQLDDLEGLRGGRLEIGASATVAETWLPGLLGRFRRAHPDVAVAARLGNSEHVIHAVRERAVGLGIVGRLIDDAGLVVRPVYEDHLALFAAADHPDAARLGLRLADLAGEAMVLREQGSGTRAAALGCLGVHGFALTETVELGSNEAVKRAVAAGLGIGVLSAQVLDVDLRAGDVTILDCTDWDCRRQFWLVHRADRLLSRAERAFAELL